MCKEVVEEREATTGSVRLSCVVGVFWWHGWRGVAFFVFSCLVSPLGKLVRPRASVGQLVDLLI